MLSSRASHFSPYIQSAAKSVFSLPLNCCARKRKCKDGAVAKWGKWILLCFWVWGVGRNQVPRKHEFPLKVRSGESHPPYQKPRQKVPFPFISLQPHIPPQVWGQVWEPEMAIPVNRSLIVNCQLIKGTVFPFRLQPHPLNYHLSLHQIAQVEIFYLKTLDNISKKEYDIYG